MVNKIYTLILVVTLFLTATTLKITPANHLISDPQSYLDALTTQQANFEAGIALL